MLKSLSSSTNASKTMMSGLPDCCCFFPFKCCDASRSGCCMAPVYMACGPNCMGSLGLASYYLHPGLL